MSTETKQRTWIFFEEGKQNEPEFEIQADDHEQAFDLAFDSYGPQVNDLFYKEKESL
jgi:hypothetical protein